MIPLTILYVEDEEIIHATFVAFLTRRAENVISACNGLEGLKSFAACRPDLVVTDISMPGMDGMQMAALIRADQPDVPFVFLTASPERLTEFKHFDPGIDRVFSKPVDLHEFSKFLENHAAICAKHPISAIPHTSQ